MGCAASTAAVPGGPTPAPSSPASSTDSIDVFMHPDTGSAVFFLDRGQPTPPAAPTPPTPLHAITVQPPAQPPVRPPHPRHSTKALPSPPPSGRPHEPPHDAAVPGTGAGLRGRVRAVHKPPSPVPRRLWTSASPQRAYERHQTAASADHADDATSDSGSLDVTRAADCVPRRAALIDLQERQRQCELLRGAAAVRPETPSPAAFPLHPRTRSRPHDDDDERDSVTDLRICRLMRRTPSGRLARACARQTARPTPPPTIIVVTAAAAAPPRRGCTAPGGESDVDGKSAHLPPLVQPYTLSRSEQRQILRAHRDQLRMLPDITQTVPPRRPSSASKSRRQRR